MSTASRMRARRPVTSAVYPARVEQRVMAWEEWREAERLHAAAVDDLTGDHLARRRTGRNHPIEDFLFVYYRHRPGQLRRWHPGPGVTLLGEDTTGREAWPFYRRTDDGIGLDVSAYLHRRGGTVRFVRELLAATADRPPRLACFGLHEWAMVYGLAPGEQRHESLPLRLTEAETDAVVETSTIRCSHFDAFRFFTDGARPLNTLAPTPETQVANEQPGCLHATMDLYKWATKLGPAVPGSLLVDTFRLARRARELDMRASPYDVSGLGYDAVPIETPEGRTEYVTRQRELAADAEGVRGRLLSLCADLEQISTRLACPHPGPEPPSTRGE